MSFTVPANLEAELDELITHYPVKRSASLMLLHALQEHFGYISPEATQWVARKLLDQLGDRSEQYVTGDVVQFPTPDGLGSYAGTVLEVNADGAVRFDFNHPLAGQPVRFEVQLIGVL